MDIVYATATTNVLGLHGDQILVGKGTHWPASDPIVARNPGLFSTDPRYGLVFTAEPDGWNEPVRDAPPVETATAAPGERRGRRYGNTN